MHKLGMTKEGVLREYFQVQEGCWLDVVLYALLCP